MSVKWELHVEGTLWSGGRGTYDYPITADEASLISSVADPSYPVQRKAGDFQSVDKWKVLMTQTHTTVTEMSSHGYKKRKSRKRAMPDRSTYGSDTRRGELSDDLGESPDY